MKIIQVSWAIIQCAFWMSCLYISCLWDDLIDCFKSSELNSMMIDKSDTPTVGEDCDARESNE